MHGGLTSGGDEVSGEGERRGTGIAEGEIKADEIFLGGSGDLGQGEGFGDGESRSLKAERRGAGGLVTLHHESTQWRSRGVAECPDGKSGILVQEKALLVGSEMKEEGDRLDAAGVRSKEIFRTAGVEGLAPCGEFGNRGDGCRRYRGCCYRRRCRGGRGRGLCGRSLLLDGGLLGEVGAVGFLIVVLPANKSGDGDGDGDPGGAVKHGKRN